MPLKSDNPQPNIEFMFSLVTSVNATMRVQFMVHLFVDGEIEESCVWKNGFSMTNY